jgi:hypothetical protein
MEDKIREKRQQHEKLPQYMTEAGWKQIRLHIFPLGTICAIHGSSIKTLTNLGVESAQARKVLTVIARNSLEKAQEIVAQKCDHGGGAPAEQCRDLTTTSTYNRRRLGG